jgi:poly(A) polymerase
MTKLTKERLMILAPEEAVPLLTKLEKLLRQRSIDCYVVGGFIRDALMGQPNSDIDVVVAGEAASIASDIARAFSARMVTLDDVNQVSRVILSQAGGDWHLDGQHDLSSRTIRAASEASFQRDPARLIRAVRFAATLDFSIEPSTEALIQRDHKLVTTVAPERLRDELYYILETPRAYHSFRYLDRLGLLDPLMPELTMAKGVTQPKEHFWDVFDHSLETVAAVERLLRQQRGEQEDAFLNSVPWTPDIAQHFAQQIAGGRTRGALLKLAGLLHDIGKPITKTIEQSGKMRFLGHPQEGTAMVVQLMKRLRFSNREIKMVQLMTEHHMRPGYLVGEEMPTHRAIYRYFRATAEVGIDTLFLGLADHLAARGPTLDPDEWRKHTETVQYMLDKWFQEQATVVPIKLIDGHTLIDDLGLAPGPQIGELLEAVREAQAAGEIETAEEALELVTKRLGRN